MKTRGRPWTDENRAKQRGLIRDWKPWEKSRGSVSRWGKMTSSWNGYKSVEFLGNPGGIYDTALVAARGILEALTMQMHRRAPTKRDLKDFRIAILVIFRFGTEKRDIAPYGDLFQKLSSNITEDRSPSTVESSECKDIDIVLSTLRTVLEQYCCTK